eukprot:TRINITY_DN4166_c0_g1_i4.p1 TRINITY_DN4166_c0_g1~~TRINITY_DN4166_c0_g1_i4.p1  ORF type:complete len:377 (+),score=64.67 TRINITY_DN4166_c0_g1_i4:27-1157(+)
MAGERQAVVSTQSTGDVDKDVVREARKFDKPNPYHDEFGFELPVEIVQKFLCYLPSYRRLQDKMRENWLAYFQKFGSECPKNSELVKKLVRKGIPPEHRGEIWLELSGAKELKDRYGNNGEFYPRMIEKAETAGVPSVLKQIEQDADRTFPQHTLFSGPDRVGTSRLTRVLKAYSVRNPMVGYCQSLNFVAALLLMVTGLNNEEDAFWLLAAIVEKIQPSTYYSSSMVDWVLDGRYVFDGLLQWKLPTLYGHFSTYGVTQTLPLIISSWFMCIFANSMPSETMFRVWDTFFYEGNKVLFRVSLALLQQHTNEFLKCTDPGLLYNMISSLPSKAYDAENLMEFAFNGLGSFPHARIDHQRDTWRLTVLKEMDEIEKR